MILARSQDPNTIANNSIIVFRPYPAQPNYLVIHRVIRIIPSSQSSGGQIAFWTKGDANLVPDAWDTPNGGIPASQVLGVYQSTLAYSTGIPTTSYSGFDTHIYNTTGNSQTETFAPTFTATDNSGSQSSQTISESIKDTPPTVAISQISPTPVNTGQTVTLSFSAADPDGTISSIIINWGDGSTPDLLAASATSDTHSFTREGYFTINVTATDNSGSKSRVSSAPFSVNASPNPSAPAPTIVGLDSLQFYSLIGIAVAAIFLVTFLWYRRMSKPSISRPGPA